MNGPWCTVKWRGALKVKRFCLWEAAKVDHRPVARSFPDGPANEMILDLIEDLKQQIRKLEEDSPQSKNG